MLLLKIIIMQIYWYVAVYFGPRFSWQVYLLALVLVGLNYYLYQPKISRTNYVLTSVFFSLYGLIQDGLLAYLGFIEFQNGFPPLWLNSLWLVFIIYYGDTFNYLASKAWWIKSLLGGFGGVLAYFGGIKIAGLVIIKETIYLYYAIVFMSWSIFFPLSFKFFYQNQEIK